MPNIITYVNLITLLIGVIINDNKNRFSLKIPTHPTVERYEES